MSALPQNICPQLYACCRPHSGQGTLPSQTQCRAGPEDPDQIEYEAESPDESALVSAAKMFGFFFPQAHSHKQFLVRETQTSKVPPLSQQAQTASHV